mmetsp:Transcript_47436/g.112882  ORF Transcript_47436/g.112882 Transcript_47436/m.112882 type:complete len:210 (+) Transcript_47436:1019-1648(+)
MASACTDTASAAFALLAFLGFRGSARFCTGIAIWIASTISAPSTPSSVVARLCPRGRPGPAGRDGLLTLSHSSRKSATRLRIRSIRSCETSMDRSTDSQYRRSSPSSMVLRHRARRNPYPGFPGLARTAGTRRDCSLSYISYPILLNCRRIRPFLPEEPSRSLSFAYSGKSSEKRWNTDSFWSTPSSWGRMSSLSSESFVAAWKNMRAT